MYWAVLKRLYELNKESIDRAVIKRMLSEQTGKQTIGLWVQDTTFRGIFFAEMDS